MPGMMEKSKPRLMFLAALVQANVSLQQSRASTN